MHHSDVSLLRYDVAVRQQPLHARISAMKVSDRRPVDPPIVVQLSVTDLRDSGAIASPTGSPRQNSARYSHLTNPYYFMYAALVDPNNDDEVKFVADGGRPSTSGALVASIRVLKDYPNIDDDAAFFIFPDICVRLEGSWRFKLSLFVIEGDKVKPCATTYSAPFFVYPGKQYPGVQVSTPLTRALAAQGVKLRIRKEIRERRPVDDTHLTEAEENSSVNADENHTRSPPKRRRTLPEPPSELSNVFRSPRQQMVPTPAPFNASVKAQQYDPRLRRASLDVQTQRPNQARDWIAPRVLDDYQHNLSPTFPKSEPDFLQWSLLRPAHPSPEATQVYSGVNRRLSPGDNDRCAPEACPIYSWSSSTPSRDMFSPPTENNTQAESGFWQMSAVPRGPFEHHASDQHTWNRYSYGAPAH
ncbi:velvet factor-domain-containing protein [Mycena belliarum]|uniref:Velvet factor-domain-containing protein n=1 Tax=Mycena belliarum TaxID=1033014 RepID=A0AAD6XNW6_9AGAR|nr:velvet factor-domain-containing protein [Mycena belliae]